MKNFSGLLLTPADTWKQPDARSLNYFVAEEDEITMNCHPDYCLMEIFDQLEMKDLLNLCHVCERFSNVIRLRIFSTKFRKLPLRITTPNSASIWQIFDKVLPQATDVELNLSAYKRHPAVITRLMDIFTRNLADHLERLDFIAISITNRMHEQLKPVLKRLKVFKLDQQLSKEYSLEFDFVHFCSKLRKMRMRTYMTFEINADVWPSLESATIGPGQRYIFQCRGYIRFFEKNPQLKRLKLDIYKVFTCVTHICSHLPNLEILKINTREQIRADSLADLVKLKQLKVLALSPVVASDSSCRELMSIIGQIRTLEKLELCCVGGVSGGDGVLDVEHCQLALLGRQLAHLTEFSIVRYILTGNSLLEFLEATPHLTSFKFDHCGLVLDGSLLKSIVRLRGMQAKQRSAEVVPLRIFVGEVPAELEDKEGGSVTVNQLEHRPKYFGW